MKVLKNKWGDVVQVFTETEAEVTFCTHGGGFMRRMGTKAFYEEFNEPWLKEYVRARVSIEGFQDNHIYNVWLAKGQRWNGWVMPYFEFDEALKFGSQDPNTLWVPADDEFQWTCEGDYEFWKGEIIRTPEGDKIVYAIGAGSWCWSEVTD